MSVEIIRALAEPLRLRLLRLCKMTALTVGELSEILSASQPNVSHHVKQLRELNLLHAKRQGSRTLYALNENADIPAYLIHLWSKLEDLFLEIPEVPEDQKRMYKVLSKRKQESFKDDFSAWRKLQPDLPYTEMFARLGIPQWNHVVEVGCGEGDFLTILNQNFHFVTGIDISPRFLHNANLIRQNQKTIRLLQANAGELPLASNMADAVYFRMSLRFFTDREKCLEEAVRISKPGGRISIIDLPETQSENSEEFFQKFCQQNKNCNLVHFLRLSPVFLCILQIEKPE